MDGDHDHVRNGVSGNSRAMETDDRARPARNLHMIEELEECFLPSTHSCCPTAIFPTGLLSARRLFEIVVSSRFVVGEEAVRSDVYQRRSTSTTLNTN